MSFVSGKRELSEEMDLCSMMCVSLNTKVHGVLMMLSLMKSRKKFDIITGTFVFHHVSHHLLQSLSSAAVWRANALYTVCGCCTNFIHSFIKRERSCTHTHDIYHRVGRL